MIKVTARGRIILLDRLKPDLTCTEAIAQVMKENTQKNFWTAKEISNALYPSISTQYRLLAISRINNILMGRRDIFYRINRKGKCNIYSLVKTF